MYTQREVLYLSIHVSYSMSVMVFGKSRSSGFISVTPEIVEYKVVKTLSLLKYQVVETLSAAEY